MVFLGVLLNATSHTLALPLEKHDKALALVNYAIQKKKVSIKFVQKLTGTLNFINWVIVPGRALMRGMYTKLRLKNNLGQPLKPHHHINLGQGFVQDCLMWKHFFTKC